MNVICEQSEGEAERHVCHTAVTLLEGAVNTHSSGEGDSEHKHHRHSAQHSLLRQRPYVFAMGVAEVAGVGADGGELVRALVAGIHKLVCAGAPARYGTFVEHAQGRRPTVETLEVGGVGGDIADGLYLVGDVVRRILTVFAQLIHHICLIGEEKSYGHGATEQHPPHFHAKTDGEIDGHCAQNAYPRRTRVRQHQACHQ